MEGEERPWIRRRKPTYRASSHRAGGPGTTEPGPTYEDLHPQRTPEQIIANIEARQDRQSRQSKIGLISNKLADLSLVQLVEVSNFISTLESENEVGGIEETNNG